MVVMTVVKDKVAFFRDTSHMLQRDKSVREHNFVVSGLLLPHWQKACNYKVSNDEAVCSGLEDGSMRQLSSKGK